MKTKIINFQFGLIKKKIHCLTITQNDDNMQNNDEKKEKFERIKCENALQSSQHFFIIYYCCFVKTKKKTVKS